MIGDSGAFSAFTLGKKIDIDGYAAWLDKIGDCIDWPAALDVINDAPASWANFVRMRDAGYQVVPTIHAGGPIRELDRYVDQGCDFVGLGGMAIPNQRRAVKIWLNAIFRYAAATHPHVRFHGWGGLRPEYLWHLPFYSSDSSAFGSVYRFGRLPIFDPVTGRTAMHRMDRKKSMIRFDPLIVDRYGVDPAKIRAYHPSNRLILYGVAALYAQQVEAFYQQRHVVTPPASLGQQPGIKIHFAEGNRYPFMEIARLLRTQDA